ncbi:MAG: amidohydrolase [Candidatus Tectomicrobia bacterium]|uniref:Amidohydrolase n=1 Tax=Tectimicrobiota bacterium TaxID=2528274 RepID=A0A932FXM1_UNCTE|nr:amidohydrolase [Candidatus Tectomicrobia bacterium]
MIVDVHYHMLCSWDCLSETFWDFVGNLMARLFERLGKKMTVEEVKREVFSTYIDPEGEKLMRYLDQTGIDRVVICALDYGIGFGEGKIGIEEQNRQVAAIARKNSDRVIAFAGVDPRRKDAPQILERCFRDYGMRGLKYHPDAGFYPNGPESYAALEQAVKYGAVLLSHTGPLPPPSRSKFVQPIHLDDLGVDFPTLKVIAAHCGEYWWRDWAALAHYRPNLFGDLAEWQFTAAWDYERFCHELREAMTIAGPGKIVLGTDTPFFEPIVPVTKFLEILKALPQNAAPGTRFTQEEVDGILGLNAKAILGL